MADASKKLDPDSLSKQQQEEEALRPEQPSDPNPPAPERQDLSGVSQHTPSGAALHKVGVPPAGADLQSDKEIKRGEQYAAEKRRRRWGY